MHTALTIAGSDSSGGAGIQADLKTFQALGVFGMSAVTAVTVQNTQKVYDIQEMRPQIVHDQITCLFSDIPIDAVKIGMVASIPLIEAIARALGSIATLPPVVLDPVMISKSGYALLKPNAQAALVRHLFPLASVVTPNLPEAEALLGKKLSDIEGMKQAAMEIAGLGANMVVVKGGHLGAGKRHGCAFRRAGMPTAGEPTDRHGQHPWHRMHLLIGHCRLYGTRGNFFRCRIPG